MKVNSAAGLGCTSLCFDVSRNDLAGGGGAGVEVEIEPVVSNTMDPSGSTGASGWDGTSDR